MSKSQKFNNPPRKLNKSSKILRTKIERNFKKKSIKSEKKDNNTQKITSFQKLNSKLKDRSSFMNKDQKENLFLKLLIK